LSTTETAPNYITNTYQLVAADPTVSLPLLYATEALNVNENLYSPKNGRNKNELTNSTNKQQ